MAALRYYGSHNFHW